MEGFEEIWKVLAASIVVWRLASLLFAAPASSESYAEIARQQRFPISRAMDCLCWASVWMSAQTTIWVVCGFTGVLLNWFVFSGISRLQGASRPLAGSQFAAQEVEPPSHPQHERSGAAGSRATGSGAVTLCL